MPRTIRKAIDGYEKVRIGFKMHSWRIVGATEATKISNPLVILHEVGFP